MGQAIRQLVQREFRDKVEIISEVNLENKLLDLNDVDCIVSFSAPNADMEFVPQALRVKVPCVVGTTGFTQQQLSVFEELVSQTNTSMVLSSNFSPLVNVQVHLAGIAAKLLTPLGYEFGIVDEHHNKKKDSPSGTTKMIRSEIMRNSNYVGVNYWKEEIRTKQANLIDEGTIKIGGTPGIHEVRIAGQHGRMQIDTCMFDRLEFARGALQSTLFLCALRASDTGKIYTYKEVLGII